MVASRRHVTPCPVTTSKTLGFTCLMQLLWIIANWWTLEKKYVVKCIIQAKCNEKITSVRLIISFG